MPLATIPSVRSEAMKTSHTYCWSNTQKQLCNSEAHTEARGQAGVLVYALTHTYSLNSSFFLCVCVSVRLPARRVSVGGCSEAPAHRSSDFSTSAPFPLRSCASSFPTFHALLSAIHYYPVVIITV